MVMNHKMEQLKEDLRQTQAEIQKVLLRKGLSLPDGLSASKDAAPAR